MNGGSRHPKGRSHTGATPLRGTDRCPRPEAAASFPSESARRPNHRRRPSFLPERQALTEQLAVLDARLNDAAEARHAVAVELHARPRSAVAPQQLDPRPPRRADPHEEALPPLPQTAVWLWGRPLRSACLALLRRHGETEPPPPPHPPPPPRPRRRAPSSGQSPGRRHGLRGRARPGTTHSPGPLRAAARLAALGAGGTAPRRQPSSPPARQTRSERSRTSSPLFADATDPHLPLASGPDRGRAVTSEGRPDDARVASGHGNGHAPCTRTPLAPSNSDRPGRRSTSSAKRLGADRIVSSMAVREHHGQDEGLHDGLPPDAVAFPASTDDVATIVASLRPPPRPGHPLRRRHVARGRRRCAARRHLHRPLGHGPHRRGQRRGSRLPRRRPESTAIALNDRLKRDGLFFPIDPGADATFGGMASTRASGTNAVRYGTMRDNVLGLTAVLADGSVVRTGGRARKSSAGYDLTRLLVGAEGTLGVITEVRLRLYGIPEAISAATCSFETLRGGGGSHDRDDPVRHPGGAHRVPRRGHGRRGQPLFGPRPPGAADAVPRVPRLAGRRRGAGRRVRRDRRRSRRHPLGSGDRSRRPQPPLEGAPRRLLRRPGVAPGLSRPAHRRVRAGQPPGRLHHRDPGRPRRRRASWHRSSAMSATATSTSCCSFDPENADELDAGRGDQPAPRGARPADGRHLHRRARHRLRQARLHGGRARPKRDRRPCARSRRALDPLDILNPGKVVPTLD